MDINKTKLHYSSQVLPASEMCLLIAVSGKRIIFIWDNTGCRHGHLVCFKAVLFFLALFFFLLWGNFIFNIQYTKHQRHVQFQSIFCLPEAHVCSRAILRNFGIFFRKLSSQIDKSECVRMFWLSWLQGLSVYGGNVLQPLICLSPNKWLKWSVCISSIASAKEE